MLYDGDGPQRALYVKNKILALYLVRLQVACLLMRGKFIDGPTGDREPWRLGLSLADISSIHTSQNRPSSYILNMRLNFPTYDQHFDNMGRLILKNPRQMGPMLKFPLAYTSHLSRSLVHGRVSIPKANEHRIFCQLEWETEWRSSSVISSFHPYFEVNCFVGNNWTSSPGPQQTTGKSESFNGTVEVLEYCRIFYIRYYVCFMYYPHLYSSYLLDSNKVLVIAPVDLFLSARRQL